MSRYAYDFNRVPGPSAREIADNNGEGALTYGTGQQQSPEYLASLEAAGLHTPLIWEHNIDSILGGYDYGVSECKLWEASHPAGKLVYLACDLNDGALAGRDPSPFVRGWCDTTREAAVGTYGGDDALNFVRTAQIPKAQRYWGVVNWIRQGRPDNDPWNIDFWTRWGADLVQLIGSPIPDTDQNLILKPTWWTTGGAPTPSDPHRGGDTMHIALLKTLDGRYEAMLVDGAFMVEDFGLAAPGSFLNIPADAWAWYNLADQNKTTEFKVYNGKGWDRVRARS